MAFAGFETYDKRWYALRKDCLESIQTAQFGAVQVYRQGSFTQPRLLFVPDYNKQLECYAPLFGAVAQDFCVFSYDLLGQGGTAHARGNAYDMAMFVDQLHHVFTYFGLAGQPVHVAAQGLGCTIFAAFFAKHADDGLLRVGSLTLITPTGISYRRQPVLDAAAAPRACLCRRAKLDVEARGDQYEADLQGRSYQYFSMDQRSFCTYHINQSREAVLRHEFMQRNFPFTAPLAYARLAALTCPVRQVVLVKYDEYTDNEANRLFFADNLPGFGVVELDNTRNEVGVLAPNAVAGVLREVTAGVCANAKIMKISFAD